MQRRDFIKAGAAVAAAAPAIVRAAAAPQKVRMGFIGVGGAGAQLARSVGEVPANLDAGEPRRPLRLQPQRRR